MWRTALPLPTCNLKKQTKKILYADCFPKKLYGNFGPIPLNLKESSGVNLFSDYSVSDFSNNFRATIPSDVFLVFNTSDSFFGEKSRCVACQRNFQKQYISVSANRLLFGE